VYSESATEPSLGQLNTQTSILHPFFVGREDSSNTWIHLAWSM